MKTLRQFKEDLNSVESKGYSASNYPSDFEKTASDTATRAFYEARKISGFRSGVSRFIFSFSEIRATGIFEAVKNSVMARENETLALKQRDETVFSINTVTQGTSGIFSVFHETLSNLSLKFKNQSCPKQYLFQHNLQTMSV
jgi:hypothetical protein